MTKLKTIKFEDIKIPVTTDEFKENLRKYLLPFGTKDAVYVQGKDGVPISKIENFSDIYKLTADPRVCVLVDFDINDVADFMDRTNQVFSADGYWKDKDSKCRIYENKAVRPTARPVFKTIKNPQWIGLDNQIFRELFVKMFGVFSGYEHASDLEEEAA